MNALKEMVKKTYDVPALIHKLDAGIQNMIEASRELYKARDAGADVKLVPLSHWPLIEILATRNVLPETYSAFGGRLQILKRVGSLPQALQKKLASGAAITVVHEIVSGKPQTCEMAVCEMKSSSVLDRAIDFEHGCLRPEKEQAKLLAGAAPEKKTVAPEDKELVIKNEVNGRYVKLTGERGSVLWMPIQMWKGGN